MGQSNTTKQVRRRELFVIPGGYGLAALLVLYDKPTSLGVFIGVTAALVYVEWMKYQLSEYGGLSSTSQLVVTTVLGVLGLSLLVGGIWYSSLQAIGQGVVMLAIAVKQALFELNKSMT